MSSKRESIVPLSEIREQHSSIMVSFSKRIGQLLTKHVAQISDTFTQLSVSIGVDEPIIEKIENSDEI